MTEEPTRHENWRAMKERCYFKKELLHHHVGIKSGEGIIIENLVLANNDYIKKLVTDAIDICITFDSDGLLFAWPFDELKAYFSINNIDLFHGHKMIYPAYNIAFFIGLRGVLRNLGLKMKSYKYTNDALVITFVLDDVEHYSSTITTKTESNNMDMGMLPFLFMGDGDTKEDGILKMLMFDKMFRGKEKDSNSTTINETEKAFKQFFKSYSSDLDAQFIGFNDLSDEHKKLMLDFACGNLKKNNPIKYDSLIEKLRILHEMKRKNITVDNIDNYILQIHTEEYLKSFNEDYPILRAIISNEASNEKDNSTTTELTKEECITEIMNGQNLSEIVDIAENKIQQIQTLVNTIKIIQQLPTHSVNHSVSPEDAVKISKEYADSMMKQFTINPKINIETDTYKFVLGEDTFNKISSTVKAAKKYF